MDDLNSLFFSKEESEQIGKLSKYMQQTLDISKGNCWAWTKYRDIDPGLKFCTLWDLPLGSCDEGGLEHSDKIYNMLRKENGKNVSD